MDDFLYLKLKNGYVVRVYNSLLEAGNTTTFKAPVEVASEDDIKKELTKENVSEYDINAEGGIVTEHHSGDIATDVHREGDSLIIVMSHRRERQEW